MTDDPDRDVYYAEIIRAMARRNGGSLTIKPEEMSPGPFEVWWRPTDDGGVEVKISEAGDKERAN